MFRLVSLVTAGAIGAGAIGLVGAAWADEKPTDDGAIMAKVKIGMAQAIAAAEQQTGGRAYGSGIEDKGGTVLLEVSVEKGDQRMKVLVDSETGKVVRTVADDKETNDGNDGNDGQDEGAD